MGGLFDELDDVAGWPGWASTIPADAPQTERIRAAGDVARWLVSRLPPGVLVELPLALAMAQSPGQAVPRLQELTLILEWWNGLAAEKYVPHAVKTEPVSMEILKAWTAWIKTPVVQAFWRDIPAIEARIRESTMCREGWFRLEKLLGGSRNAEKTLIIEKLLDGGYKTGADVPDTGGGWDAVRNFKDRYQSGKRTN